MVSFPLMGYRWSELEKSRTMEQIRLGKSELIVSRVGFGGIPITRVSCQEAERCIRTAIDLGINFIDTATGYGDSEEKIGKAIKGLREKLVIATKSPPSTPQKMSACIDKSLRQLQIDTIDLYQFHLIKDQQALQKSLDLLPTLEKARDRGKIRHIGATVHGVDFVNNVVEADVFETVMVALNFITCEVAESAIPNALQHDLGVIAMKPLAGGHIEDAYLAFKYFIAMKDVVPIVGIETPEQIVQIVKILDDDIPPTSEELRQMDTIRRESGSYFCRRCGYCMPCEQGVQIFPLTIFESLGRRLPAETVVNGAWASAIQTLDNCIQCRECEDKCPYDLGIMGIFDRAKACYNELRQKLDATDRQDPQP